MRAGGRGPTTGSPAANRRDAEATANAAATAVRPGEADHVIPLRKTDIVNALSAQGSSGTEAEREKLRQICRLLGAIYHYEYFDELERLRNDYFYFNPELDGHVRFDKATLERAYGELIQTLTHVLHQANFIEVPHDEIERAHREHALVPANIEASIEDYREVRFFRRGHHRQTFETATWFGLRKRSFEADVYDDVVMLAAMKDAAPDDGKRKKSRKGVPKIRPGAVMLKYFRNIASADLNALFPDVRVVMSLRDQLVIGVPALLGGIPILLKLASTMSVLVLLIGFYLGLSSAALDDEVGTAFAALGGLVALGGFIVTQWVKFQRQTLMYQKILSDNIYFRNVNNNAGIFDYIIGAAEDQECKEAFLAYRFLHAAGGGLAADELDRRIEAWLKQTFGMDIDFECDDALRKLGRLGLLRRDGERLSVLPLDETLNMLDWVWGNFFPPASAAPATTDPAKI